MSSIRPSSVLEPTGTASAYSGFATFWTSPRPSAASGARRLRKRPIQAYYDAVWIYGDPALYDSVREYDFSAELLEKVRYTGYLDQRLRLR